MSSEPAVWPEPVERVASFLREVGAEARLEELQAETPTAEGAADACGTGEGQRHSRCAASGQGQPHSR